MPITSTLDISGDMNYSTNISSRDLVAEGLTPFDSYIGVMDSNMYHATLNQNMVDYLINEIETYIQGSREVLLCSRPTYTLHLPQDSVATVTWQSSDNIRIITGSNPYEVTIVPLSTVDGWVSAEVSTLKHHKQLARYPIHVFQDDFPLIDTVSNATDTLYVNTTMLLGDTFCVNCGKTVIVTDTLHCAPSARIIVRPGGKLVVDGGTLTNSCTGEMWQGIFVEGHRNLNQSAVTQGKVELRNGATVENALCGIRTSAPGESWHTSGGIVQAENATFRNNRKAVEFLSYADTVAGNAIRDNLSDFTRCTFTIDDNNLFAANDTTFDTHVSLWDVKGVTFKGCTFTNATTDNSAEKRFAIYAEDAGFIVKAQCDTALSDSTGLCRCPADKASYCQFSGFRWAVRASTTGNAYPLRVDEALFSNNGTGVLLSGNNHATVTHCDFDLDSQPGSVVNGTGLHMTGCTGYLVEENDFHRTALTNPFTYRGIRVIGSGNSANLLYRNSFSHLHHGIRAEGNNGGQKKQVGLEFRCNTFQDGMYDISIDAGASVARQQGSASEGADNHFSGTTASSLHNAGSESVDYYHNGASLDLVPYSPTSNFTVWGNAASNPCQSTLCNPANVIPSGPIKSPDAGHVAMKARYDSLTAIYEVRGYADIVADPSEDAYSAQDIQAAMHCLMQLGELERDLHTRSKEAVRSLLGDTPLDLQALEQWFAATPGLSAQYSLAETEFLSGESNALTLQGISAQLTTDAERDEYDNYMAFNALKEALSGDIPGHANWPAATETQIAELQRIADAATGRSSVMARGVLCFFFNICYDDDDLPVADLRHLANSGLTGNSSRYPDVSMKLHPNPAGNILHVEFEGIDDPQGLLTITDLAGVVVLTRECHEPVIRLNVSHLAPGLYVVGFKNEKGVVVRKFVKL